MSIMNECVRNVLPIAIIKLKKLLDGRTMIMDIKFTADYILEKEFKKSMKGYNVDEVDQFLDLIREDYDTFYAKIAALEEEIARLKQEASSSNRKVTPAQPVTNNTNFDILKRLSNLEKHVFGSKLYE